MKIAALVGTVELDESSDDLINVGSGPRSQLIGAVSEGDKPSKPVEEVQVGRAVRIMASPAVLYS